ncbi:hypothetical protein PHET_07258 [Paragonimus heterotremus]|uniref:Uncharacterized protein n=1 Tax=Paragonimus heterotremus TaxID=100268 RepID=A0A8J4WSU7_9TREM|nr:hypothetical protein PHET_07258 [Paragonimus heterotremus]
MLDSKFHSAMADYFRGISAPSAGALLRGILVSNGSHELKNAACRWAHTKTGWVPPDDPVSGQERMTLSSASLIPGQSVGLPAWTVRTCTYVQS